MWVSGEWVSERVSEWVGERVSAFLFYQLGGSNFCELLSPASRRVRYLHPTCFTRKSDGLVRQPGVETRTPPLRPLYVGRSPLIRAHCWRAGIRSWYKAASAELWRLHLRQKRRWCAPSIRGPERAGPGRGRGGAGQCSTRYTLKVELRALDASSGRFETVPVGDRCAGRRTGSELAARPSQSAGSAQSRRASRL